MLKQGMQSVTSCALRLAHRTTESGFDSMGMLEKLKDMSAAQLLDYRLYYLLEEEVVLNELGLSLLVHALEGIEGTLEVAFEGLES